LSSWCRSIGPVSCPSGAEDGSMKYQNKLKVNYYGKKNTSGEREKRE